MSSGQTLPGRGYPSTHFADPSARELLFEDPWVCPWYPRLTLAGVAITPSGQVYLVMSTPAARFYAGPDTGTVTRTVQVMTSALRSGRAQLDADLADGVMLWSVLCWEAAIDELAATLAGPALENL